MSSPTRFCCPHCHGPLESDGGDLACAACRQKFPVAFRSPVLMSGARAHLVGACVHAERLCVALGHHLAIADEFIARNSYRAPLARRLAAGLRANIELVRRQQQPLLEVIDKRELLEFIVPSQGAPATSFQAAPDDRYTFSNADQNYYARTDWCGTPEGEQQVRTVEEHVFGHVDRHCQDRRSATVLGAAAGRYMYDLAGRFEHVLGVDSNPRYVDFFHRLKDGPIRFSQINFRQPISDETVVTDLVASLPEGAAERLARIEYAVADATALPIATGSQSAAISIFFADIMPLHFILKEAHRVLAPGGKLINFGPLVYYFNDPTGHLAPGEAKHVMRSYGFRMEEERWLEMPFQDFHDIGQRRTFRIWTYVLTRE